jgi:hypothetical protein
LRFASKIEPIDTPPELAVVPASLDTSESFDPTCLAGRMQKRAMQALKNIGDFGTTRNLFPQSTFNELLIAKTDVLQFLNVGGKL